MAMALALVLTACSGATSTPTAPTAVPTAAPATAAIAPTLEPTQEPTLAPTDAPTEAPTLAPTNTPEPEPTHAFNETPLPEATTVGEATSPATDGLGDPCAVLKQEDVVAVFGKLDGAPSADVTQQGGGKACLYSTESGLLFVGLATGGAAKTEEMLDTLKKGGAPIEPLEGVGDKAYIAVGKVDPAQTNMAGVLLFRKGDTVVNISAMSSFDEAKLHDALQQLGLKAINNLQ